MASKSSSQVLTDHEEIRRWAEERGAKPAAVRSTEGEGDIGIIRLDFPGYSGGDSLEEVSWDEWFEQFDESNLALVVQQKMANGKTSNFNKLVSRDSVEESAQSGRSANSSGGTATPSRSSSSRSSTSRSSSSRSSGSRSNSGSSRPRTSRKSAASVRDSGNSKRAGGSTNVRGSQSTRKKSTRRRAA
jgi:hypothetical protein